MALYSESKRLPTNSAIGALAGLALLAVSAACAGRHLPVNPQGRSLVCGPPPAAVSGEATGLRDVVIVGNNWKGTATVFDPQTLGVIKTLNVTPDRAERMAEINGNTKRRILAAAIRNLAGEGNDQLVDDVFTSKDGRYVYASRPSFADVVAINVATGERHWRTPVEGFRADHAALSPDGRTLLVSASTARKVHALDTSDGHIIKSFPSGDEPHENNYCRDGSLIYHASIGRVFIPTTWKIFNWTKGDRWFEVIDAHDFSVLERIDMGKKMKDNHTPWIDSAVRPMTVSPDGRYLFFQLSFLHGFAEYDLEAGKVTRVAHLPIPEAVQKVSRHKYQLNSAHHGITISGDGSKLCVAATMSGYAAIVDRATFKATIVEVGPKPYWATTSADGRSCYVSVSEKDRVAVIPFDGQGAVKWVAVERHPQRVRTGKLRLE